MEEPISVTELVNEVNNEGGKGKIIKRFVEEFELLTTVKNKIDLDVSLHNENITVSVNLELKGINTYYNNTGDITGVELYTNNFGEIYINPDVCVMKKYIDNDDIISYEFKLGEQTVTISILHYGEAVK